MLPDCRTCGACCGPEHDVPSYADLVPADLLRLSARFVREQTVREVGAHITAIRTKRTRSGTVCSALRGTVGRRVSCSIYANRPQVCRDAIQPGDRACLDERRRLGIGSEVRGG